MGETSAVKGAGFIPVQSTLLSGIRSGILATKCIVPVSVRRKKQVTN